MIPNNIFGLLADLVHLCSYFVIIQKIRSLKETSELSYRTQEIYLMVYLTRYGDIIFNRHSLYLTSMKIIYIALTMWIIYQIKYKKSFIQTYNPMDDDFNHYLYIYPSILVITLVFHSWSKEHPFFEFSWSYSIWLEAVAIIPQLWVVHKKKQFTVITGKYIIQQAIYRMLYILNWVYRIAMHGHVYWIKQVAGILQTIIFVDFAYQFQIGLKTSSETITLPYV